MTTDVTDRRSYWRSFYASAASVDSLQPPSQFAAFVAQEIETGSAVFDVGCGNGRDSLFFATLGFKVVALDQSQNAIAAAQQKAGKRKSDNLHFVVGSITDPYLDGALASLVSKSACVYARFFLHAITESEQTYFFQTLAQRLQPGHKVALEYRTDADQFIEKTAPPHFRRYQSADAVNAALTDLGFQLLYAIEGQGFAKYGNEDAIVARAIFQKL